MVEEIEKNFPLFYEYNRKRTWAPQTVLYNLDPVIYERWNLKKNEFFWKVIKNKSILSRIFISYSFHLYNL